MGGPEARPAVLVSRGVHEAAGGFGAAAEEYECSRPDYPPEAVDRLVQELELTPSCRAMDLGAGTGKLTRMLASTRAAVVAVEPVEAMRQQLAAVLPDVRQVAGTAEALPFADGVFDAVVCAPGVPLVISTSGRLRVRRPASGAGRSRPATCSGGSTSSGSRTASGWTSTGSSTGSPR
jgi:SAM-dependent methyltransferase